MCAILAICMPPTENVFITCKGYIVYLSLYMTLMHFIGGGLCRCSESQHRPKVLAEFLMGHVDSPFNYMAATDTFSWKGKDGGFLSLYDQRPQE